MTNYIDLDVKKEKRKESRVQKRKEMKQMSSCAYISYGKAVILISLKASQQAYCYILFVFRFDFLFLLLTHMLVGGGLGINSCISYVRMEWRRCVGV